VTPLRNYGWLLAAAVEAVLISGFGAGTAAADALQALVPLPWGALGTGVLVFAAFAALHFRLQLVRGLERELDRMERSAAASRLIHAASADGRRWLRVVQENLELIDDGSQTPREAQLYLEGARANADKVEQAFERIEGNQSRLDEVDAAGEQ